MTTETTRVYQLEVGPMENFNYVIEDIATGRAALVDPAWEVDKLLALIEEKGLTLTDVFLTHCHPDHVNGLQEVRDAFDVTVHGLQEEIEYWGTVRDVTYCSPDAAIQFGETRIKVLHTPGHTVGHVVYWFDGKLIAGDMMFVYGVGHCRLPGANPAQLFDSINFLAETLPAETVVYPGHHYSVEPTVTMGEQVKGNPFFHFDTVQAFTHYREVEHDQTRESPYQPHYV
jgi:glyoxylase-like metal-dependent hydrolase (beta-lactamase superfamily II)